MCDRLSRDNGRGAQTRADDARSQKPLHAAASVIPTRASDAAPKLMLTLTCEGFNERG